MNISGETSRFLLPAVPACLVPGCPRHFLRGAQVTGLIRDTTPQSHLYLSGTINRITTVRGEIEDYALIERALNEYEIETVFHLGAQTIVTTANRGPVSTFKSNIEGTWNILEACRNVPTVRRIVVASSDKAYGDQKNLPYDERPLLKDVIPTMFRKVVPISCAGARDL